MGTHPIFESDFDCLTDFKMSEVEDEKSWEDFCQQMKKATRSVHDLQDATIQALFVATLYVGDHKIYGFKHWQDLSLFSMNLKIVSIAKRKSKILTNIMAKIESHVQVKL